MPTQTPTTTRLPRHVLVVVIVAVTVTMVVASIIMNTPLGPSVAIPGPLSAQHAVLTEDCAHCHSAEMDSTKGVLHGINSSALSLRDSALCLDCHDLGDDPMQAHAVSAAALAAWTGAAIDRAGAGAESPTGFALPPHSAEMEYACSVCHVEHGGRHVDLTAMTEAQCQSCHAVQFDGFHAGHPAFDGYPYERRLRIAFDHASHVYHNFLTNDPTLAPTSCTDCHSVDPSGAFMLTASFEQSCAQCHDNDVRGTTRSGGAGLAFLALPAIDTLTLDDAGVGIGQWPADAGVSESPITPFTRLLIAGDPGVAADLRVIDGLDLLDLLEASDEELAAVGRVAWAIKLLVHEIAVGGHGVIVQRLERTVGADRGTAFSPLLAGGLPRALVRECASAWFPDLEAELAGRREGADPPTDMLEGVDFDAIGPAAPRWASLGGWYRDDMDFALKYRTTGHADAFLKAWLDLAVVDTTTGEPVLSSLAARDAVGQCLKCHSVDASPSGSGSDALVNWLARRPDDVTSRLTRFAHSPHLPLVGEDGCLQCHQIEPQPRDFELSYRQRDPGVFVSAFGAMEQASCASCHSPSKVATSCLDCHDYHAHPPATRLRAGSPLKPLLGRGGPAGGGPASD